MTAWRQQINQHIIEPAAIHGLPNGELPAGVLVDVRNGDGIRVGRLCAVAARSWAAMVAAAKADGVLLDATDTYRPRDVQQQIFTDRYRTTDQGNGSRVCGGKRWFLRKGKATAACPGTSNHGRGVAVDVRFHGDSLGWLEAHALGFGWQWEVTSEDWHIHYMPGDDTPPAVLDAEAAHPTTTPAHSDEEDDMVLIQVTAGDDKDHVFLVVGNSRRQQDKTSADRLIHAGVRYQMMDDIAWEQVALTTTLASAKG